ncbi:MAG TPA: manganese efflux pump MntP family protein [Prolixibacteraceae bacterium]|nr:manganese efflux pump MntP family protein [Prolixibacteraceae bacterium]
MGFLTIFLIAISLSFDSFAVSVCSGLSLCRKHLPLAQTLKIAFTLAVFQGIMPVLGWLLGSTFNEVVTHADHWIAFGLLAFLGIKMIVEGRKPIENRKVKNPTRWNVLIPMAIATSIDAFAVGISFSFFLETIIFPALLIGGVTASVSLTGLYMGRKVGKQLAGKAEIAGGVILILIGLKILIEHLFLRSALQ